MQRSPPHDRAAISLYFADATLASAWLHRKCRSASRIVQRCGYGAESISMTLCSRLVRAPALRVWHGELSLVTPRRGADDSHYFPAASDSGAVTPGSQSSTVVPSPTRSALTPAPHCRRQRQR